MLVYTSGKYSVGNVDENIAAARKVAIELWRLGHAVICPHENTNHYEVDAPDITWDQFIVGDLMMIARCDAMVMLEGWETSAGAKVEKEYAESLSIPIYFSPLLPKLHPTEVKCPQQAKTFAEELGLMYRTHLSKNNDYSPSNVLGTGEIGVITRMWDKVARLANLSGMDLQIRSVRFEPVTELGIVGYLIATLISLLNGAGFRVDFDPALKWVQKQQPKHEALEDSYSDLSVYAIIARLLRRGVWGK